MIFLKEFIFVLVTSNAATNSFEIHRIAFRSRLATNSTIVIMASSMLQGHLMLSLSCIFTTLLCCSANRYSARELTFQNTVETMSFAPSVESGHSSTSKIQCHKSKADCSKKLRQSFSLPHLKPAAYPPGPIKRTLSLPLFAFLPKSLSRASTVPSALCHVGIRCARAPAAAAARHRQLRMAEDDSPSPSEDLWASLRRRIPSETAGAVGSQTDPAVRGCPPPPPRSHSIAWKGTFPRIYIYIYIWNTIPLETHPPGLAPGFASAR